MLQALESLGGVCFFLSCRPPLWTEWLRIAFYYNDEDQPIVMLRSRLATGWVSSSVSSKNDFLGYPLAQTQHSEYGFPQNEQAYMNGKCLNLPRVHDFDEESRKESQFVCTPAASWCTHVDGFSRDVQRFFQCSRTVSARS